mmetsp:Transcript_4369/g.8057  ORF Transcript_4369/g.8057 Transcript_4369/m.8057 type:complete len:207 (-) Transcript_4369:559-1179(-)
MSVSLPSTYSSQWRSTVWLRVSLKTMNCLLCVTKRVPSDTMRRLSSTSHDAPSSFFPGPFFAASAPAARPDPAAMPPAELDAELAGVLPARCAPRRAPLPADVASVAAPPCTDTTPVSWSGDASASPPPAAAAAVSRSCAATFSAARSRASICCCTGSASSSSAVTWGVSRREIGRELSGRACAGVVAWEEGLEDCAVVAARFCML